MNRFVRPLAVLTLLGSLLSVLTLVGGAPSVRAQARAQAAAVSPELAYLKQVNQWRPPSDPQLLFILMGQFANAGRQVEGSAYFEELLKRFGPELTDNQKAQYLVAIASLRAAHASEVFLPKRIGWVRETVGLLDEAKRLSNGQMFVVRWMSGVVRAQIPGFFGEREAALADLLWCVEHADAAPHRGWLREVYFQLAAVYRQRGDAAASSALSGVERLHDREPRRDLHDSVC